VQGAVDVLRNHPEVTHFILDDGFQHRRAKRDFNLVLISATQPFGYEHVLPRGLLREPLAGLRRADAFLITRCSLVTVDGLCEIESLLAWRYPTTPIFHCDHVQSALFSPSTGQTDAMESLAGRKVFLTAGIGDPAAFERQIAAIGCQIVGVKWFGDHHAFAAAEVSSVLDAAAAAGADLVLTTEKDWVKIGPNLSPGRTAIPFAVARLEIRFHGNDGEQLIARCLCQEPQSASDEYAGGSMVDEQF
jgi:tetraacyldisaccharide 4'-kinase